MKLWKDTFHDSDEYVALIFDNYFNPEYVECASDGDKLVAAMIGIPYTFKYHNKCDKENDDCRSKIMDDVDVFRGLYLCGLATDPNYRGRGLMSKMIERINSRARDKGFDFTFLIPANEGLIKFYEDRDYVEAFYRINYRFLVSHNFKVEFEARLNERNCSIRESCNNMADCKLIDIKSEMNRFDAHQLSVLDVDNEDESVLLNNWLCANDSKPGVLSMQHTAKDWNIVFRENQLSGGMIVYVTWSNEIRGVAFVNFNGDNSVSVPYIVSVDECARYSLLQNLNSLLKSSSDIKYPDGMLTRSRNSEIKIIDNNDDLKIFDNVDALSSSNTGDNTIGNASSLRSSINDLSISQKEIVNSEINKNESSRLSVCSDSDDVLDPDVGCHQNVGDSIDSDRSVVASGSIISDVYASRYPGDKGMWLRDNRMNELPMGVTSLKKDYVIECWSSPYSVHEPESIWRPYYEGVNKELTIVPDVKNTWAPFSASQRASVYGMLRVLNPVKILKLLSNVASAEKFSILNDNSNLQNDIVVSTNNGKYYIENTNMGCCDGKSAVKLSQGVEKISVKQLSEIVFKAPGTPEIVEVAFGIPNLSAEMGLLLD